MNIAKGRLAAAACVSVLTSAVAYSDEFIVTPRISGGVQNYSMGFEDVLDSQGRGFDYRDGFKVGDALSFFGGGVTIAKGRFFFDLSGQWSGTGQETTYQHMGIAIGNNQTSQVVLRTRYPIFEQNNLVVFGQAHSLDAEFDRYEYNASFGWAVTSYFSVYAGYKRANVNMSQALTPAPIDALLTGDVLFVGDYDMEFTYDGAFLGATYSVPVRTWGSLAIQSSIAQLDGSFTEKFTGTAAFLDPFSPFGLAPIDPAFRDGDVFGQSTGFNIGISFTGNIGWLSDRLSYTVGVDRSVYKFDSGNDTAFWAADFEETNTRARLDLRYRFGGGE